MSRITWISPIAAGLALLLASGAIAAVNPAAPNPYPERTSKLLVDFDNAPPKVTADPLGTGENRASTNTDPQFVSQGTKSVKVDMTSVGQGNGWADPFVVINLPQPVDIQGYQMLTMDVFVPADSLNNNSTSGAWYQIDIFVLAGSAPAPGNKGWHNFGYRVETDGGELDGDVGLDQVLDGQWNTLEIPISADQAATLGNVNGLHIGRDSGDTWRGPVYIDALRAVFPTTTPTTAGG